MTAPIEMADFAATVTRPAFLPATQPTPAEPFPPLNPNPTQPRTTPDCGCINGDLCTHVCDTTRDRIELAFAPQVRFSCSGGFWTAVA